jgi:hypothetical protein
VSMCCVCVCVCVCAECVCVCVCAECVCVCVCVCAECVCVCVQDGMFLNVTVRRSVNLFEPCSVMWCVPTPPFFFFLVNLEPRVEGYTSL